MNREELIKKWLDHNLSTEEQTAFEELEDYTDLIQIDTSLKDFKAPKFATENNYTTLQSKLQSKGIRTSNWIKPLIRIAAILAIFFSIYFYVTTLDTEFDTAIAQQTSLELPDASTVDLNANSTLTFNKNHWSEHREVKLSGEAFFRVAKGQKFDVITDEGLVRVLGTEFNVKQRQSFFEVVCYEGLVTVTHNKKTVTLEPGNTFQIIDDKRITNKKENNLQPTWLLGESSFKSVPLKYVISEFENQYNFKIISNGIDTSRLFTGSFSHKNLDLALKSITIPLNLSYSISVKSIELKRE